VSVSLVYYLLGEFPGIRGNSIGRLQKKDCRGSFRVNCLNPVPDMADLCHMVIIMDKAF